MNNFHTFSPKANNRNNTVNHSDIIPISTFVEYIMTMWFWLTLSIEYFTLITSETNAHISKFLFTIFYQIFESTFKHKYVLPNLRTFKIIAKTHVTIFYKDNQ